jgi:hypothetical protein
MPLWDVTVPRWNGRNFTQVKPVEILAEFDEPLTFTFTDSNGSLMLAHICSEGAGRLRYIVAPTTFRIVHELKTAVRSIREALDQPIVRLLDLGPDAVVCDAWVTTLQGLPERVIPASDVMLHAWQSAPGPDAQPARRVS